MEALAGDPAAPLPEALGPEAQAAVLDAALDHLDLRFGRDLVVGKAPEAARATARRCSSAGARSAVVSPPLEVPPPRDRAPELGHGSLRARRGGGVLDAATAPLALLDLRLALHDLGDPPDGYPPLAQIEFLPTRLRLAPREGRVELDEAWLVRIVSLNDLSRFDLRPSWRVRLGAATVRDAGCAGCLAGAGRARRRASREALLGPLDLYAGADVARRVARRGSPGIADGARAARRRARGASRGSALGRRAALLADARWRWLPGRDAAARPSTSAATLRLHLSRATSPLALEARRTPAADEVTAARPRASTDGRASARGRPPAPARVGMGIAGGLALSCALLFASRRERDARQETCTPMERRLVSGDEAVAAAACDGGVHLGTGYPGTPSTEILEAFSRARRPGPVGAEREGGARGRASARPSAARARSSP